ncbi:hypothetical protein [Microvirga massiliensis]|uniref:hypothetical protein n=1 Tax=Microvirga massiliensis TaxID=1033741 RepID=UPI00062BF256|nr:hypothetical protein [Microvirga massiliensis]
MDNTNTPNNADIIESLKAVPDIRKRLIFAVLALVSVFAPIASASAFGFTASVSVAEILGNFAYVLPILGILVVVAPIVPALQANTRIIDMANGAAALFATFMLLNTVFEAVKFAGRASELATPSWGLLVFVVYLWFAVARAFRAVRSRPVTA